jgi:rubrerythrin
LNPQQTKTQGIDFTTLSLRDALDLAVLIEEEARDRYEELAEQLRVHHTPDAAAFFAKMVRIEELHRSTLVAERTKRFGNESMTVRREMIFEIEAPDYDEVRMNMTLKQALMTALHAESKAHEFFVTALASVTNTEVRALFAELAEEEIEHQNLVKAELSKLTVGTAGEPDDFSDEPVAQ